MVFDLNYSKLFNDEYDNTQSRQLLAQALLGFAQGANSGDISQGLALGAGAVIGGQNQIKDAAAKSAEQARKLQMEQDQLNLKREEMQGQREDRLFARDNAATGNKLKIEKELSDLRLKAAEFEAGQQGLDPEDRIANPYMAEVNLYERRLGVSESNESPSNSTATMPLGEQPLGSISAKYESQGNPNAVGYDRNGGYSYGKYQIASRTGSMNDFITYATEKNPELAQELMRAGGADAARLGASTFKNTWGALNELPEFADLQEGYIRETHFIPAAQNMFNKTGLDVGRYGPALQEAVFSMGVQHGASGAGKIAENALKNIDLSTASEQDIIVALYNERMNVDKYFKSSTPDVRASVANRFKSELEELTQYASNTTQNSDGTLSDAPSPQAAREAARQKRRAIIDGVEEPQSPQEAIEAASYLRRRARPGDESMAKYLEDFAGSFNKELDTITLVDPNGKNARTFDTRTQRGEIQELLGAGYIERTNRSVTTPEEEAKKARNALFAESDQRILKDFDESYTNAANRTAQLRQIDQYLTANNTGTISGLTLGTRQVIADIAGIDIGDIDKDTALSAIGKELGLSLLKPTFGGAVTEGERETLFNQVANVGNSNVQNRVYLAMRKAEADYLDKMNSAIEAARVSGDTSISIRNIPQTVKAQYPDGNIYAGIDVEAIAQEVANQGRAERVESPRASGEFNFTPSGVKYRVVGAAQGSQAPQQAPQQRQQPAPIQAIPERNWSEGDQPGMIAP